MTGARAALAVAVVGGVACRAQTNAFYGEAFPCDLAAATDPCGTARDGTKMVCYPGSQLGGQDFCTETCQPAHPPSDPGLTCLTSGALLHACNPSETPDDPVAGCPAGLQCYRTDL